MLLSYIICKKMMKYVRPTYNPHPNDDDELMGPHFLSLSNKLKEMREKTKDYPYEEVEITSFDNAKIKGYFYEGKSNILFIIVTGYNGESLKDNCLRLYHYLAKGYNVLLVENRGCENSTGIGQCFGTIERFDIKCWIDFMLKRNPNYIIYLEGWSMGAAIALSATSLDLPINVKGVVSDCAYSSFYEEMEDACMVFVHFVPHLLVKNTAWWFKHITKHDLKKEAPKELIKQAKIPILYFHGVPDRFVKYKHLEKLVKNTPNVYKVISVDNAGHAACSEKEEELYFDTVYQFVKDTNN